MSLQTDQDMRDLLIRVDTKVDAIVSTLEAINRRADGHENRLTVLERESVKTQTKTETNMMWIKALWAVCGSGFIAIGAKLINLV